MEEKRKRGRPRTLVREAAVALAMDNYWREGLHALSVNEVCRRTNLSKPALYREFGGEDGLQEAALVHYVAAVIAPMGEAVAAGTTFTEAIEILLDQVTNCEGRPQGCLLVKMRGAPETLGPQSTARVAEFVQNILTSYAGLFLRAQEQGEVRDDLHPDQAARYMDTQITTVQNQLAAGHSPEEVRPLARLAFSALLPK